MNRTLHITLLALMAIVALSACGQADPEALTASAPPTRTPRPTWTPLSETPTIPKATPKPPQAAQAIPTSTPQASAADPAATLRAAREQTTRLAAYQIDYVLSAKNLRQQRQARDDEAEGKVMAQLDFDRAQAIMRVVGVYNGANAHTTSTSFCGCNDGKGRSVEFIAADGKVYMKRNGEDVWYLLDTDDAAQQWIVQSAAVLQHLLPEALDLTTFATTRDVTLDGHACTVYRGGKAQAARAVFGTFLGYDAATLDRLLANLTITDGGFEIAACDDGYVRELNVDVAGLAVDANDQPFALRVDATLSGFDTPISIYAPSDATPYVADTTAADLTALAFNGGNIRAEPTMQGSVLGQLHAGETVVLYERSADGIWYFVEAPEATGWVHNSLLTIDPSVAAQVPLTGGDQASEPVALTATVYNGGNVRAEPSARGQVLDQINARETVRLLTKNGDGVWYKITNVRGITGWVHRSLLTIDPNVAAQVPVG